MAELVDDLERLDYVERRPDPSDGRAKLVCLTERGWDAMREGRRQIGQIEAEWAATMGVHRFNSLASDLQLLLDGLDPNVREGYVAPRASGRQDEAA